MTIKVIVVPTPPLAASITLLVSGRVVLEVVEIFFYHGVFSKYLHFLLLVDLEK